MDPEDTVRRSETAKSYVAQAYINEPRTTSDFSEVTHGISPCKHTGNNLFWCETRSLIQNKEHTLRALGSKQRHLPLHSKAQRAARAATRARILPPYVYPYSTDDRLQCILALFKIDVCATRSSRCVIKNLSYLL